MPIFILTIIAVMFLADAWWWWRADRLLRPLRYQRVLRGLLAVFMVGCIGGLGTVIASRLVLPAGASMGPVALAGLFIWHFIVLPAVAIPSLLLWIAGKAVWLIGRLRSEPAPPVGPQPAAAVVEPTLTRRQLLGAAISAAPPLITAIGTTRAMGQLDEFRTRRIVVPVPNLPTDLDGMTIVQVSDVHVGHFTRGKTLGRIVDAVNNLRPDLIMHTGDLINHALSDLPAALDMTRRLEGRFGQFLCEGNHDLIESRAGFEQSVTAAGLPLLLNTTVEARVRGVPVQVLGLRWGWPATIQRFSERRSPDEAIVASMGSLIAQRNADAFGILLAHHPHAFDIAANAGIPLTLSGHTHGGQLHLSPGLGFGPVMYRYWSGLYQRGDASLVVSNGVGNWFPLRINAPAEIVHITLRRS
ncbi:MAG TPA: metallophosphoesterase [Tepidisphaeraceae bacterium]|nr:metallophosphoesterase [Tepidisphaeraceae bacterium]